MNSVLANLGAGFSRYPLNGPNGVKSLNTL